MKTLTIVLTDGPYISEQATIACRIANAALKRCRVNIFLYLDAVHVPKRGQLPALFTNAGEAFQELARRGATIRACSRCAAARGYHSDDSGECPDYYPGIGITSIYDLARMVSESDRVIALSR